MSSQHHFQAQANRQFQLRLGISERGTLPDHVHDPWRFYASDLLVFNSSDSDQELYESAEETLEPEDQGDGEADGSSVGSHVGVACPIMAISQH